MSKAKIIHLDSTATQEEDETIQQRTNRWERDYQDWVERNEYPRVAPTPSFEQIAEYSVRGWSDEDHIEPDNIEPDNAYNTLKLMAAVFVVGFTLVLLFLIFGNAYYV